MKVLILKELPTQNPTLIRHFEKEFDVTIMNLSKKRVPAFSVLNRVLHEIQNFALFRFYLAQYRKFDLIILLARRRHVSNLIIAKILSQLGIRPRIYLHGLYVQSWAYNPFSRALFRALLTNQVLAMAQCQEEVRFFERYWPNARVAFCPFCIPRISPVDESSLEIGSYIFSGGHSNRDYDVLLEVAKKLPQLQFVLACAGRTRLSGPIPQNVTIHRDVAHEVFYTLLAKSRMVVVPLKEDVGSSGQTVALRSMELSKATIYANCSAINQYFIDGVTGIAYRLGDLSSLYAAIADNYTDAEKLLSLGHAARKVLLEEFSPERFNAAVVDHVKRVSGLTGDLDPKST